ncbi:MAG: LysE family translocator [Alphaproteobacteria bacterium]
MLTASIFLNGLVFGLILAAPAGPVGVLCIQRTLSEGRLHGLLSGLGAAVGDALYGIVAAFGISAVALWIDEHEAGLRTFGGIVLLILAARTVMGRPRQTVPAVRGRVHTGSLARDFVSAFALTITNPVTLITFASLLATFGLTNVIETRARATALVGGVFLGSLVWWLAIALAANLFRPMVEGGNGSWMRYVSAGILGAFALWALVTAWVMV